MKRVLLPAVVLAALAGSASVSAQPPAKTETILPGYWEYKAKLFGLISDTKKHCVKENEAEDFLAKPCNRHHTCVYPVKKIGDGKITLEGYWQNKEGRRANIKANGTYAPKQFTMSARGTSTQGIPIGATIQAKWLGASCPTAA